MSNPNFDTLLSTTLDNYRETLTDNVFNSRPVLFHLMEKNRLRMLSGGNKIVEPLIYDEGQAGSYGEWEQLTITPQDGITAAEFDWKSLYATIAISGLEEAKNSGEEQVISLLEAKTMQAEQTLKTKIGRAPSELQSHSDLVCRLLLEKKKKTERQKKGKKKNKKITNTKNTK